VKVENHCEMAGCADETLGEAGILPKLQVPFTIAVDNFADTVLPSQSDRG
jgi:hypothetical protein